MYFVIDYLHDDKKTLRSCSLVSRTWRYRSQYHLFSSMTVGPPQRADPIPDFITTLRESANFAVRIRDLTLKGEWGRELSVSARWLSAILEQLPKLNTLRLAGVSLTGLDRLYTPSNRFTLEHLQFVETGENSEDQTIANTLEVLGLFDRIGRITVNRAFAHEQGVRDLDALLESFEHMFPKHLSVGALQVLDRPRGIEFWLAVMRRTALKEFMGLTVIAHQMWEYSSLEPLLRDAGFGLRRLDVSLGNIEASAAGMYVRSPAMWMLLIMDHALDSLGGKLGLSYCTNLQELTLRLFVSAYNRNRPTWSQLCALLGTIDAHHTLRNLTICFLMHEPTHDSNTDWAEMTRVLRKFSALERVVFVDPLMAPEELVVAGEHVQKRLHELGDRVHADVVSSFPPSLFESWWWPFLPLLRRELDRVPVTWMSALQFAYEHV